MRAEELQLSASLEDYLEAIYHTVAAKGAARAKDIVLRMGVHNSSVTQALRSLSEKKLINYAPYDVITLTDAGEALALGVVRRHETLSKFLNHVLGLPDAEADAEACRLEHAVSGGVLNRLVRFVEYFESCPRRTMCAGMMPRVLLQPRAGYAQRDVRARRVRGDMQLSDLLPKDAIDAARQKRRSDMPLTMVHEGTRAVLKSIDGGRQLRGRMA
ncbi:MAG: metal-dependent transcriptional regulator, partial [bacterium]|nr:metal-dependent transcriptional regulator [bacterium]